MTQNNPLASVLSQIHNAEKIGKKTVRVQQNSALIREVLDIMNREGYIGAHEETEDQKGLTINLIGNLNECNVISPRFKVSMSDYQKYEQRFLPARGFGVLILTTNQGIMTNEAAKQENIGGRLISYAY